MKTDPVCGMDVNENAAAGKPDYQGVTYVRAAKHRKRIEIPPAPMPVS